MRTRAPVTQPSPCKSCGKLVLWAHTESGKWMPVDATPDNRPRGGDLVLTLRGGEYGDLLVEHWDKAKHQPGRNRYTSHFATCVHADQHRRSR